MREHSLTENSALTENPANPKTVSPASDSPSTTPRVRPQARVPESVGRSGYRPRGDLPTLPQREPPLPQPLRNAARRDFPPSCAHTEGDGDKPRFLPLSKTTERVLHILLAGDLSRLRAESVAETLGISCTTLRRRLRNDHTNYQFLLDRARQYRCESQLCERWLPGKCLADELGYLEVNSFYRAFQRWTGMNYSDYKLRQL
jgi:AraC family mar-sox-rob regulon transcriptional activator